MSNITNPFSIKRINKYYHYLHSSDYFFYGHRHTDAEINIILKGAMEITCENNIFKAAEASVVLIPPCAFHQNRVIEKNGAEMVVFHFETDSISFADTLSMYSLSDEAGQLLKILCANLERNGQKNGTCVKINESAHKLFEVFLEYAKSEKKHIILQTDEHSAIYARAVNYMLKNINQSITTEDVAHECGVCRTTLKKIFSRYTMMGCMTFFSELKLDKAKEMLLSGKSCSFVSNALGFSSQAYFSKRFKALYGVSPSKCHEI